MHSEAARQTIGSRAGFKIRIAGWICRMEKSPNLEKEARPGEVTQGTSESEPANLEHSDQYSEGQASSTIASAFPIVGIVASAGGLDAFKKFFAVMPADNGMAFVLIPHLDPTHASLMVEILSPLTSMPIVEAKHDMTVEVNRVYIIPPKNYLAISSGRLQLSEPPQHRGWQTSIDFFLRSLAQDQGERAIGIVLSGTGSHGSLGVREIKLAGGMAMAQQPDTAEYDQMPQNAIDTGVIDCVLPPDQMPAALVRYVEQPYLSNVGDVVESEQSISLLNQVLHLLRSRTKYDFRPYRKPMVLRRIQRRMGLAHLDGMADYLDLLQRQPGEVTALYKDLLISVTAFFRDPEAYRILEQELIPALIARHMGIGPIRVWVPACATGEEAYSIAMLLFEGLSKLESPPDLPTSAPPEVDQTNEEGGIHNPGSPPRIQIFASDIDADAIHFARAGIYPTSVAGDVSPERLKKFFVTVDAHHFQINKQLRESVVFSHQNLIDDAPFSKLDLVTCRNLLIYLEPEMQQQVLGLFHFALVAEGYLLLGPCETIGKLTDLFETVSKKWRVYRKTGSARREIVNIPLGKTEARQGFRPPTVPSTLQRKGVKELAEQLILNDYAPAAALINRRWEILYVTGPLVNYLEFPRGEIIKDLLSMTRPGLRTKLRATCNNAQLEGRTVVDGDARVKRNGRYIRCSITARPLTEPKEADGLLLVMFQDRDSAHGSQSSRAEVSDDNLSFLPSEDSRLAQQLEFELKSMSEELHSTIEEMESSNEELKTSNEEIMSVNEELQSVNEELETSKEELQSLNEELNTVNNQLQEKVAELDKATDDLMNLMSSTEIATIFLDEKLNIKRFTPPTKSLLSLLTTDIGRPLRDIAPKFADDKMLSECQQVLDKLTPLEREVETDEPRFFLRRILPYRTTDQHIGGVVITFVDLTQRKQAEAAQRETDARHFAQLHDSVERTQAILNTAADAIVTIDLYGKIDSINFVTETLFDFQRDELIGQSISLLLPTLFSIDPNEDYTDSMKSELARAVGIRREVLGRRKDGSTFPVDLAISRVDHLGLYTGILQDISVRKQLQAHVLEIATDEQRRIGQELHDGTQQELSGLSLFAGALCEFLNNATPNQADESEYWTLAAPDYLRLKQIANKLTDGLKETNQRVQKLSHGIMPVQIDAEGLRSALAELAAATNEQQQIHCHFEFSGAIAIANNVIATQLYRIAQEALNNALKHGLADDIHISLSQQTDQITLEICDNGVGFDPQRTLRSPAAGGGLGLRIMEYRASVLGGVMKIERNLGLGTTVRCSIPSTGGLL
jgi:two-component system, chemotaxis family, CheB/CheR fusion protein